MKCKLTLVFVILVGLSACDSGQSSSAGAPSSSVTPAVQPSTVQTAQPSAEPAAKTVETTHLIYSINDPDYNATIGASPSPYLGSFDSSDGFHFHSENDVVLAPATRYLITIMYVTNAARVFCSAKNGPNSDRVEFPLPYEGIVGMKTLSPFSTDPDTKKKSVTLECGEFDWDAHELAEIEFSVVFAE